MKKVILYIVILIGIVSVSLLVANYPLYYMYKFREMDANPLPDLTVYMDSYSVRYIAKCRLSNVVLRASAINTIPKINKNNGKYFLKQLLIKEEYLWEKNYKKNVFLDESRSAIPEIYKVLYLSYGETAGLEYLIKNMNSDDELIRGWTRSILSEICEKQKMDICAEIEIQRKYKGPYKNP